MKKHKIIPIYVFYIAFFICNFFNSFMLLRGWFNPNISADNSFMTIILSTIGDLGVLFLIFLAAIAICKKDKNRIKLLVFDSFILTFFIIFLQGFSNMFSTLFSYTQIVSFKNPSQGKLIMSYVVYFLRMFLHANIALPSFSFIALFTLQFFIKIPNESYKVKTSHKLISLVSGLVALLLPMIICASSLKGTANEFSTNGFYGSSQMGTYNYYIYSIKDLWKKDPKLTKEKEAELTAFLSNHKYSKNINNKYLGIAEGKNLIIIQMEAINNFVINLEIDGDVITPNLNKLANEGYYNSRFYSAAGMGNTSDCEFSSIIGLYPNGNDLSIFELDGEHYPTIAKEFKKEGYTTFSVHGNEGGFYNRDYQHISLFGFDEHIDQKKLLARNPNLEHIHDWISDDALLQECVNIYQEQTNPFLSYNILVSSHAPFGKDPQVEEFYNKDLTPLANSYMSYLKYVDKAIGNFIDSLKSTGLYENSIIVLYGDHTSSLLISDTESITKKDYSSIEFRLEMQNVPFIMIGEGITPVIDNSAHTNVDILPTIANLFNLNPSYKFGANMLSDEHSLVYNPRSLDLIYDDFVILTPSKNVYYTNKNAQKLTRKEINKYIQDFEEYKYLNDLLVCSQYFK